MGTTAEKLAYLKDTKTEIREAIIEKGTDVPENTPFREYADKIRQIESGGIALVSIEVTKQPDKTTYLPNERFDPSGMEVTATYDNGATLIATGYSWTPDGNLAEGTTEITVRYTEGGVTATAVVGITVERGVIGVPAQSGTLTYNGAEQSPVWSGYEPEKMTISGVTSATNAGTYTAKFTPTEQYQWGGGDFGERSVNWTIGKANGSITLSPKTITLNSSNPSDTVSVTRAGDGAITASTSPSGIVNISVSGETITISSLNEASGTVSVTVNVAEGTNHKAVSDTISVSAEFVMIYGVMWDRNNSSTKLTRLTADNDPNGLVNTNITEDPVPAVGSSGGSSPFDTLYPWSEMTEWNIIDGVAKHKKGDPSFSRTQYDTMVYIPEYWFKVVDGNKRCYYIATAETEGFTKHPGSGQYISRYHASSGYVSKSGIAPLVNITRATARNGAKGRGTGWSQSGFDVEMAWRLLYLVEYADWDGQTAIGRGYVDGNSSALNSGATDTMVYHTGRAAGTDGKTAVQYRGIEHPWGSVRTWCDGINFNERRAWICLDPDQWADDTTSNYTDTGVTLLSSGWIKDIGFSSTFPWALIPNTNGGSDSTYIPDYVGSYSGWRVLNLGGYWGNGSNAGVLFFYGYSSSGSYSDIGVRLQFDPSQGGNT